jgi:hypothetical protein
MNISHLLFLVFITIIPSPAATLVLLDTSTLPSVPSEPTGAHYDGYPFPSSLLPSNAGNPIVSLSVDYDAASAPPGFHEILETYILFSSGSTVGISSTPTFFSARVDFSPGITNVSDPRGTAFVALHGPTPGLSNLLWTATYMDGSQAVAVDGIIPESSVCGLGAVAVLFLTGRRRRRIA